MLCYIAINETVMVLYSLFYKVSSNFIFYNIYYVINFLTLFYLFKKTNKSKIIISLINLFTVVYFILIPIDIFVLKINYSNKTQVIPYIFAGLSIIFLALNYFIQILKSNEIIKVDRNIMFWISIAFLFYYLAFSPIKISQNFYGSFILHSYLYYIRIIATVLMNLILIFGFLWSKKA